MTRARAPWFEYDRPSAGKLTARPIHAAGWAILFGAPVPGLVLGFGAMALLGKPVGVGVSLLALAVTLFGIFRLVVARGRPAR